MARFRRAAARQLRRRVHARRLRAGQGAEASRCWSGRPRSSPSRCRQSASETITVSADVPIVDVHKTDSSTNIVPRADRVAAGRRPRLPAPRVHRARRGARARRLPLHQRRSGHRRRRQRLAVDDPRRRRRSHRSGERPLPRALQPGRDPRVPRDHEPLRHRRSAARPAARCRSSPSRARTTSTAASSASSATRRSARRARSI